MDLLTLSPLLPQFSAPNVGALMSTRAGGVSLPPFDSLNLRPEVGDDPLAVAENRRRLVVAAGVESVRLDQVHGRELVVLDAALLQASRAGALPQADASLSTMPGVACEVQVADCLPVLLAHRGGRGVAAAHAGWRGLAAGIVEHTLAQLCAACAAPPQDIEVWLGACIGASQFEVGADVLQAFGASAQQPGPRFVAAQAPGKWLAHLSGLARDRLAAAGVTQVQGNDGSLAWCTVSNPSRFFSFRRERISGRMSALVWLRA
ncbi:MAG: peptidoglycan editing factor PgeF [Leptothrix sp. (in: b-proteobacteria)]